jgi:hypothetical protein
MDRGVHADLPLDEIAKVFVEKYPSLYDFKIGSLANQVEDNTSNNKQ